MRHYPAGAYSAQDLAHAALAMGREAVTVRADDAGKPALLAAFAQALAFPAYFGHNFDALEECLGEWAEALSRPTTLIWDAGALPGAMAAEFTEPARVVEEILDDVQAQAAPGMLRILLRR